MKLVFVTQNEGPFRMRWMDELAKYIEVVVFHLGEYDSGVDKKYIDCKLERAVSYNIGKSFFNRHFYHIDKILLEKPDILLLDGYGFLGQVILILFLVFHKIPYILTVDGGFVPTKESIIRFRIKRFCVSNAKYCMSTGEKTDSFLIHYGAQKNKILRHNLSDIKEDNILKLPVNQEFRKKLRELYKIPLNSTIFLYCGKLTSEKGLDVLYEAINKIQENNIKFLLIGSKCNEEIDLYNKLSEDNRVIILPFIERNKLFDYYKLADIFIFPTKHDVWGMVISEAMSQGVPVLSSDMCLAAKEMIIENENGWFFSSGNIDDLVKQINIIYKTDVERMRFKCLETAREYCLEEAVKQDIQNFSIIYNNLVEKNE